MSGRIWYSRESMRYVIVDSSIVVLSSQIWNGKFSKHVDLTVGILTL